METIYLILIIAVAGPIIGSLIGVLRKPSEHFILNMLAFAAGVMLAISFLELIPESIELSSIWLCVLGVSLGALLMYGLDKMLPHVHPEFCGTKKCSHLRRSATYLIVGIFLHNLPEGMAMAAGEVVNFKLTLVIALAIAIHNIPEGICTSAPYFFCTKKRWKSFLISSSTAIPLLIGFLVARFVFQTIPLEVVGVIIGVTAGLMIYISGDELIPTSCNKHQKTWSHSTIFSLIVGVLFVILLGLI
ncbi:ZIP family metal transporter [Nanoarchaeota archaeon]